MARHRRTTPRLLLVGALLAAGVGTAGLTVDASAASTGNAFVVSQGSSVAFNPYQGLGTTIDSLDAVQGMTQSCGPP